MNVSNAMGLPETFKMVRSSEGRNWQNLQLTIYSVEAHSEPVRVVTSECYTLQLVLKGKGILQGVFAGRSVQAPLRAGSLCLLLPTTPVDFVWNEPGSLAHLCLASAFITELAQDLANDELRLVPRPYFYDPLIEQIGTTLIEELEAGGVLGAAYADTLARALGIHLLRHYSNLESSRATSKGLSDEQLKQVDAFIDQFLSTEICCLDLARLVGMPMTSFARYFKALTGLPPYKYLIRQRVERAKELLNKGMASVADVAHMVGFFDQSHLVRHFKSLVGVTPTDYCSSAFRKEGFL
jgi:AraC family transcriptional regulator